jgi:hypothetical protein
MHFSPSALIALGLAAAIAACTLQWAPLVGSVIGP